MKNGTGWPQASIRSAWPTIWQPSSPTSGADSTAETWSPTRPFRPPAWPNLRVSYRKVEPDEEHCCHQRAHRYQGQKSKQGPARVLVHRHPWGTTICFCNNVLAPKKETRHHGLGKKEDPVLRCPVSGIAASVCHDL